MQTSTRVATAFAFVLLICLAGRGEDTPAPGDKHQDPRRLGPGETHDVVIYGGTSGAVVAAVRAAMLGASVVVISPDTYSGGLSSGGLGYTDSGNTRAIGGLAREFYHRVWKHY